MIDDYETAIKIEEGKYADVNTFKTMQKNIDQLREENKKLREVNLFNKDIKDLKVLKIGDVCYIDDPITTHEILKDRVKQLEEENQKLKTEIEKIKLDYIMRAVKLNRNYKQTADEYSDKYYKNRIEWCKTIAELTEKIDNLQKGNKGLMFYKERTKYWRKNWNQVLGERNELAKKVRIYRRMLKHG